MDQFKISTHATLLHINTRKEGNEDDKALAIDLKLTTRTSAVVANYFGDGLQDLLYLKDGSPRFNRMDQIGFDIELMNYLLILHEQHHYGVTIKKFKIQPVKDFQLDLTFSVSFHPTSNVVATLAEFLDEMIDISLAPENKELFEDQGNATGNLIEGLSGIASDMGGDDPLYEEAKANVLQSQKASISAIQRHLRIGYNRAARLIEALEAAGIVSAMQRDGSRTVL